MISFIVKGMSCGHCAQQITQTIKKLDPLAVVTIDVPTARVDIDSQLPANDFETAINATDYLATLV